MGNEVSLRSGRYSEELPFLQLYALAQDNGNLKGNVLCWNDEHSENLVHQSFDSFEG
jgi:hypothetical protein